MELSLTPVNLIHKKILAVMSDIDAITKNRRNTQGSGYNFRGIDDIYNELHGPLAKHGVFTVPEVLEERSEERQSKSGGNLIYRILRIRYTFFAEDGSNVSCTVIGEGMDSGDKASNKAMAVAHKYALMQTFAIPTEDAKDPENQSHDVKPRPAIFNRENKEMLFHLTNTLQVWEIPLPAHQGIIIAMHGQPYDQDVLKEIIKAQR